MRLGFGLGLRPLIGLCAALGTMAFVAAAAMLAPGAEPVARSAKASCPESIKARSEVRALAS